MKTQYLTWERKHQAHERHVAALVGMLLFVLALAAPIIGG